MHLLVVLVLLALSTALGGLGLLSADTAGATAAKGRVQGKVDVLLGVETDDEGRDVDNLLADADMALADEDAGVVNGLGETELVDARLQAALQEILNLEGQHVIELHTRLVEHTDADQAANEGIALKETLGIFLVEGQKLTARIVSIVPSVVTPRVLPGRSTDLGQSQADPPDLTLVAQAILSDKLQLRVSVVSRVSLPSQST